MACLTFASFHIFPDYYSVMAVAFDGIKSELLQTSLNKERRNMNKRIKYHQGYAVSEPV
jgi:hypothetical protein